MTSTPRFETDEDQDVFHYGDLTFTAPEVACNHDDAENDPREVTHWKQHSVDNPVKYLSVEQVMSQLPAEYRQLIYDKHQEKYEEFLRDGEALREDYEAGGYDDPQWWKEEMKFWEICAEQMKPTNILDPADDVVSLDKLLLGRR